MQVAAVVLLHNEDVFAERVIRNVVGFCDRIHVADHMSTDGTWEIVSALAREFDHVDAVRISHAARSHDLVQRYVGTHAWVFSPDGDEVFDPAGLHRLRGELEDGRYDRYFRLAPGMLHCVALDRKARWATGHMSPPARSGPKLFNFSAIDSWTGVSRERLHEGDVAFRDGWHWDDIRHLGHERGWEENPFRCLHACFLRRSSREPMSADGGVRLNIGEANTHRRDLLGRLRLARRGPGEAAVTAWKLEKYVHGPRVTKDVSLFFPEPAQ